MNEKTFPVSGMTCGHCVAAVTEEVSAVPGVTAVQVDLARGSMTVSGEYDDQQVKAAVIEAGYVVGGLPLL
jgi:copper chaperone